MVRVETPRPQVALHAPQSLDGCHEGHALELQDATVAGFDVVHAESGCAVAVAMLSVVKKHLTERVWMPLGPQGEEQALKGPVLQKVGHDCVLQEADVAGFTLVHRVEATSTLGDTDTS